MVAGLEAPVIGCMQVYTDNGCPEVDRQEGLNLIREIENAQIRNAQALRMLREGSQDAVNLKEALKALPMDSSLAMQWLAKKFPSVPLEILARVPVAASYDSSSVYWNRRQRRSWLRSKALALHLFSDPSKRFWEVPRADAHCVCVDVQENLMDDSTCAFLQSLALTGKLAAVLGGPPCRTYSLSRYMPPCMPRPVRGRSLETQWGFEYLNPSEREAAQVDGVLMFRMIWLYLIAEAVAEELGKPQPFMGLGHPRDPESWAQPEEMGLDVPPHGFASCWALDAIKSLIQEHKFYLWHFDQGPLGHEKRKPTTVMSSIPAPPDVLVTGPGHGVPDKSIKGNNGVSSTWPSSAWSAWAPGLKSILKREMVSVLDAWSSEKCCVLRDRENFLRHVVQGHVDFRRDCSACLAGAARGERHSRKSVHDAWTLRVDLLGPFAEGADEHGQVRYALTGILTVPDFGRVADAIRASEDIASGEVVEGPMGRHVGVNAQGHRGSLELEIPTSSLGPPPSVPLEAIEEDEDLEGYEPSEPGGSMDVMALEAEGEEDPETEGEARNVARANERWKDAAAALQLQECPTLEVPLLRVLPNKSQQSVAQALAPMITHLRYEGFMIRRLRSDRGREFNNVLVQRLCRQRDLCQTFTQGDDPMQNGRVEGYHARLKGKTRTLLKASSADPRDWPYAMRTAQAAMWAKAMQRFGRSSSYPLPFGTRVKVRTRSWERYGDVWSDRVQDATVLAPSVETCKGHVVRTAAGTLMHTTAVFGGAVQPSPQPVVPASEPLRASARLGPVPV